MSDGEAMGDLGPVVVADDDEDAREAIADPLRAQGYDVIEAADGAMILGVLRRVKVSLVITDLAMPRLSGTDIIGMVRANGDTTPFLVITGFPDLARSLSRNWSRVTVLAKPAQLDTLLHAVSDALASAPGP